MPQQEPLTGPGAAGCQGTPRQATRPCSYPGRPGAGSLLPFRQEEAGRSDKHAPAACIAPPSPQFPAVLVGATAGTSVAHETEPDAVLQVTSPDPSNRLFSSVRVHDRAASIGNQEFGAVAEFPIPIPIPAGWLSLESITSRSPRRISRRCPRGSTSPTAR